MSDSYNRLRRERATLGLCPRCNKPADRLPQFKTCSACSAARHQKVEAVGDEVKACLCSKPAVRYPWEMRPLPPPWWRRLLARLRRLL